MQVDESAETAEKKAEETGGLQPTTRFARIARCTYLANLPGPRSAHVKHNLFSIHEIALA